LIGTTLVADIIFGVQGIGSMFLSSIRLADPYLLEAILTVTVTMVVALTFLGDIVNGWLDPRIAVD
jgi:peptide/nickel transport system permease protein